MRQRSLRRTPLKRRLVSLTWKGKFQNSPRPWRRLGKKPLQPSRGKMSSRTVQTVIILLAIRTSMLMRRRLTLTQTLTPSKFLLPQRVPCFRRVPRMSTWWIMLQLKQPRTLLLPTRTIQSLGVMLSVVYLSNFIFLQKNLLFQFIGDARCFGLHFLFFFYF